MASPTIPRIGSADWVRARLIGVTTAGVDRQDAELVDWLYTVLRCRAAQTHVYHEERADIIQDAMCTLLRVLQHSAPGLARSDNPAAVLERVAARAAAAGTHRTKMAGLGGVPPNGQNWRTRYPRPIGGLRADRILAELPEPTHQPDPHVEHAARRVTEWVARSIGVQLTSEAEHAITYIIDRLVAGAGRSALLRGAHSRLATDPAMRHLGFNHHTAHAIAVWLLGRDDAHTRAASVLDHALLGVEPGAARIAQWEQTALHAGFATSLTEDDRAGVSGLRS
jgi:hypothetical protein